MSGLASDLFVGQRCDSVLFACSSVSLARVVGRMVDEAGLKESE